MTSSELYSQYQQTMQEIADVRNASAVLQWDQETKMPPKGAVVRGRQISTLTEIAHQMFTQEKFGQQLLELSARPDLDIFQKKNVTLTLEDYTKNKKYPSSFVRALSEQINKTFHSWLEARKQNSFTSYINDLSKLIDLKRQEADLLGYEGHPYNALLNDYEKGCTTQLLDKVFADMLPRLKELMTSISRAEQVDDHFLKQNFPEREQWEWGMFLIRELHFDFEAGRQDKSEHPFSTSFHKNDVRITTRIDENDFSNMTWSCIHETGHGLYEQGLPESEYGLPLGEPCSYSIHESQSRLWENNVGRSLGFWKHYYPILQQKFPVQLAKVSLEQFYKAINKVMPSLIRTEADEISYHFHVYIRYELEKKLIDGTLGAKEIPEFWNSSYASQLHVQVPDDKNGCLQDVHWSHGSFGYFPTYSLGSFYAAQFYAAAVKENENIPRLIENGETETLLKWLRERIHRQGRFYTSEELCREITGEPLQASYFVDYLLQKYGLMYNLH